MEQIENNTFVNGTIIQRATTPDYLLTVEERNLRDNYVKLRQKGLLKLYQKALMIK